jgi:uncharacterized protein involved in outer membrane biogenesis/outer membrane protein OmpA-like peptidoglycan-associated protein
MNFGLLKRWQRRVLLAVLGVLVLWGISWAALPALVQWQIEKQGTRALGRSVTVEQVIFRPWSMRLIVRGLRVAQAEPADPVTPAQLSVDEIEVNASLQSLFLWAPVADAVLVRNPQLQLTHRGQGQFDIDDVLARLTSAESQGSGVPRLSLFNLQIAGGGVQFRDAPKSVTHTLSDVRLDIPFLSNIGGRREVATHPRLAFQFNGSTFDTDAETTPFAPDRHTQARFQIKGLDVKPYLPYWPAAWPVRLAGGRLEMDLRLDFQQQTSPELTVSGQLTLDGLKLHEKVNRADLPLLELGGVDLKIDAWRPLEGVLKLETLSLDKLVLHTRRDAAGELNWVRLQRFFMPATPAASASNQTAADYAMKRLEIRSAQLHWQDAAVAMATPLALTELSIEGQDFSWPKPQVASFRGQANLQGANVSWEGTTDLRSAQTRMKWRDVPLKTVAPYWAAWFRPDLSGKSSAELNLEWRGAEGLASSSLLIKAPQIRVSDVLLGKPEQPEAGWVELAIEQLEVDVFNQVAKTGRVTLSRPLLNASRNPQGRWMVEDWRLENGSKSLSEVSSEAPSKPWQLELGPLQITGGSLNLDDRSVPGGVKFDVRDLNLGIGAWQPLAASPQMTTVKGEFTTGAQRREAGKLGFDGTFRWPSGAAGQGKATPLQAQGRVELVRFPLHRLRAYGIDRVNFDLRRAELSYLGVLDLSMPNAGLGLNLQGNLSLENVRALNRSDGEPLLETQSLSLRGLELKVDAGEMKRLKIAETALSDFFARVAIDAEGHLNLQKLIKSEPSTASQSAAKPAVIELGPIGVVKGRVLFSDHFIRPNYSADITELAGSLGALSNQAAAGESALADLSLRGRVAGSGSLEVSGRINPLTRPVALDVRGQVRDLELPQLSPYSSKYAGYGIDRGKLSAEVNYRISAEGQLQATHQIVLTQLRFGERSDSADAPNLPVKLAVALLADRNGVIDINLPVSGSINDPDFRVGPIVWKMVLNLIGKAIISPFSLIAGAFSGEEQLQQIDFAPGRADLDAASRQKLETVANMVIDKPVLRMTLAGEANLESERDAWRSAQLRDAVVAEKRRRMARDGQGTLPVLDVSPAEYPALLQSVYRRSPIPKPRNVLGVVKDMPPADMEALLLAAIAVDEADMRELAQARAQHVREALLGLKVPAAQLFLGAPVVAKSAPSTGFVPKVVLVVSTD